MNERPEIIEWRDAYFEDDQTATPKSREDYVVRTIGFVVEEDDVFVHLALDCLPDGDHRGISHIPVGMILGRYPLKGGTVGHAKDKGGRSEKKDAKRTLAEKRAVKRERREQRRHDG